jgi:MFS family permease
MTDVNVQGSGSPYPSHLVLTAAEARLIVFGVLIAMMMAALDQTIVSTALSTIGRELGNSTQLTWVVTAYLLAATVVTPIYGKLSDLYGRRVTLLFAVSVFVAGSAACALAPSMIVLIIARTFQGLGGGGLISLSQTIIGDIIPPKQRARYQAYISGVFVAASVAGPLLGGFIAEHLHWSIIFWINPPIGLIALAMIYSLLRKLPVSHKRHRIDFAGVGLLVVATTALMLALNWGGVHYAWNSTQILVLFAVFAIFAILFFLRQGRAPEPLVPFEVLDNRVMITATLACAFCMGSSIGLTIFTPIYFETVQQLTPSMSGAALVPLMVGTALQTRAHCRTSGRNSRNDDPQLRTSGAAARGDRGASRPDQYRVRNDSAGDDGLRAECRSAGSTWHGHVGNGVRPVAGGRGGGCDLRGHIVCSTSRIRAAATHRSRRVHQQPRGFRRHLSLDLCRGRIRIPDRASRHPGDAGAAPQGSRSERGSRCGLAPRPRHTRVAFEYPNRPLQNCC